MKDYRIGYAAGQSGRWVLVTAFMIATALGIRAQSPPEADAAMHRVARARALAASHNLTAAATELDSIVNSTTDDAIRDVARIMLMHVYLEEANYAKADALLIETFKARSTRKESSIRSYFALAGQTINGARSHMDRYRSFGINLSDNGLPPEAVNDLDKLRLLIERVVEQAKEINNEGAKRPDAAALLEDAAGIRATLARNEPERLQWQREIANARESLAATEAQITPARKAPASPSTATNSPASGSSSSMGMARAGGPPTTPPPPSTARAIGASIEPRPPASTTTAQQQSDAHGAATTSTRLTNVGSLVEKATQKVSPNYPQMAKSAHVTGVVTVYLEVDEKGGVAAIQRTDGPQLLRQAAVDAARRWKFKPTLIEGQPVRVIGFIVFNFTL